MKATIHALISRSVTTRLVNAKAIALIIKTEGPAFNFHFFGHIFVLHGTGYRVVGSIGISQGRQNNLLGLRNLISQN